MLIVKMSWTFGESAYDTKVLPDTASGTPEDTLRFKVSGKLEEVETYQLLVVLRFFFGKGGGWKVSETNVFSSQWNTRESVQTRRERHLHHHRSTLGSHRAWSRDMHVAHVSKHGVQTVKHLDRIVGL